MAHYKKEGCVAKQLNDVALDRCSLSCEERDKLNMVRYSHSLFGLSQK